MNNEINHSDNEENEEVDDEVEDEESDDGRESWRTAVESGNVQQLQDLIQEHGLNVLKQNYMDEDDDYALTTALLTAVRDNHLDMVQFLLSEQCRSVVDVDAVEYSDSDHYTWSALHIAAGNGNVQMVQYLIRQGFDVNSRIKYGDRSTALCIAAQAGHDDVFRCLVETAGCDIDAAANEDGDSVLLVSIEKRNLAMVQGLMEHFEKVGNVERYARESRLALHKLCAARDGSVEMAKYLVETCRVNVEVLLDDDIELHDETKATPLLRACQSGNLEMIQYLPSCGANINATDKDGNSVLHLSIPWLDVLQHFVEKHGVKVELSNHNGETALHCASKSTRTGETLQYLVTTCNANVNAANADGETALHLASRNSCLPAAQCVIESRRVVNVNAANAAGETALHLASRNGCLSVAQFVMESGHVANVNAQDKNGQTPLHISCAEGHDNLFEMTRFWVDTAGVDLFVRDKDGKTALHIAATATATTAAVARRSAAADAVRQYRGQFRVVSERNMATAAASVTWRRRYRTVLFLVTSIPIVSDDGDEKVVVMNKRSGDLLVRPSSSKRPKLS